MPLFIFLCYNSHLFVMKSGIHPKTVMATIHCSGCGTTFTTLSTKSSITVEVCSKCHPFYTGEQRFLDTAGRVNKFEEQRKRAQEHKKAAAQRVEKKKERENKPSKTLSELLAEMV